MADQMALAVEERRDFAEFLATLTPEQWSEPTLCEGWNVRKVVAHVISYEEARPVALAGTFLRAGLRPARVSEMRLRLYQDREPAELLTVLREHLRPRGLTAGFGGGIGLADCLIHHQDIRRPLGMPRAVPADRLRATLDIAMRAPVLPAKANTKGLRMHALDLDWSAGAGATVSGPGEALLMAITGRAVALDELDGPGLSTLRTRVSG